MAQQKYFINNGDKINHLTFIGGRKHIGDRWCHEFLCDCGNIRYLRLDAVFKNFYTSCGCKTPSAGYKTRHEKYGADYPFLVLLKRVETCSKKRKIEVLITWQDIKEIWLKQDGVCFYTGVSLRLPKNFTDYYSNDVPSVDRIDSSKCYTPDNIQLVAKQVNFMKQCMSHEEFIKTCKLITERFNGNI